VAHRRYKIVCKLEKLAAPWTTNEMIFKGCTLFFGRRETSWMAEVKVLIVSSSDEARDRAAVAGFAVVGYFKKPMNYTDFMKRGPVVNGL
jgi:hypothetical protein